MKILIRKLFNIFPGSKPQPSVSHKPSSEVTKGHGKKATMLSQKKKQKSLKPSDFPGP